MSILVISIRHLAGLRIRDFELSICGGLDDCRTEATTECLRLSETFPNRNTHRFGRPKGVSDKFWGVLDTKFDLLDSKNNSSGHEKRGFGQDQ